LLDNVLEVMDGEAANLDAEDDGQL